ncbi:cysteine desulfurase [Gimesia sp.]|uniref:cysteine desulfurase n=1 Tax=Gimesia sp. TaxID=2024833 RepID=UPI000C38ECCF|nr:cysteine desulfurase [Gimesia sp.]MAX35090.1 cysteine desulfurase [Gimesia sp.]HAH48116.1 cysteine desulfurase [Planctomycetaceae bacterium]|tara:strand:+ start:279 stop:1514 length:1236 start_codon:yes stop_codon:yes gene_type:complete
MVANLASVRDDFPILNQKFPNGQPLVYLDSGASAQRPRAVIDKITEVYEQYYSNVHRGVHQLGDRVTTEMEAARTRIQSFIGAASTEEIIFTSGTTMSVNMVAQTWGRHFLKGGDEIILNEMEHHANFVPWQAIARERGAILKFIRLTPEGRLDLDHYQSLLSSRTKLVAVTGMSNVLGTINPIAEMAHRAHEVGALIFVDGAQSVPHQPIDVVDSEIDFLAFSGHKVFGPSGIGVLYGRRQLLENLPPFMYGGNMISEVHLEESHWAGLPARFEAGTPPIAEAVALGTAIEYVTDLGFDAIQEQEHILGEYALQKLGEVPGLQIYGPQELKQRGTIFSFNIDGAHPEDLATLLDRKGIAVRHGHHCTMPLHQHLNIAASVRASLTFYNTTEEIDALVDAIHFARQRLRLV